MTTQEPGTTPRRHWRGPTSHDLALKIEGQITLKASGRIRDLRVVCSEHEIILEGLEPREWMKFASVPVKLTSWPPNPPA